MSAGLLGQLGFKTESVYGTAVTVDQFHPGWLSGNPVREQPPIVSNGIRAGRRTPTCISTGAKTVQGSFSTELYVAPLATLLKHMFGTLNTTGSESPYTHVASPGSVDGLSFTAQVGIPGTGGTVHPFTYSGCRIQGWTLACTAGELALLDLDLVAQNYVTATALASASYPAGCPFTFVQGSVSVGGSVVGSVKSAQVVAARPLRVQHAFGSELILEPIETGRTEYTVTVEAEFEDLTLHDLANTQAAVVLEFDDGTNSLELDMDVRVNPTTPEVGGVDELASFTFSGMCYGATDADAITATLINAESTAA